jgi:L-serine dehydratase
MVSLLDIIGPVMVGPSSSHTAGACRIALVVRALCGGTPAMARIELHGSFAKTAEGHGTDRALVGGLLGFQPDDVRLRQSLDLAPQQGLQVTFEHSKLRNAPHPNSARLTVARNGQQVVVTGASVGGGRILISDIDGFPLALTGAYHALVVEAKDTPGVVAAIAAELANARVNVAAMRVSRHAKGGSAVHVYELDEPASAAAVAAIGNLQPVSVVRLVPKVD